jgi:peptide/nickel transport system substrate-binding protein
MRVRTQGAVSRLPGRAWHGRLAILLAATLSMVLAAAWGGSAPSHRVAASSSGGSLNVLEAAAFAGSWNGLDPPTNTNSAADVSILSSIYGELFEQAPGGKIIPDLASGYKITNNGMTVTIDIRPGVTFTDGTPFDAQAVAFNINRDLEPQYRCTCAPNFPLASPVTATATDTVTMQLTHPFAPIIEAFFLATPNWIVSPTALSKVSEQEFALHPVGAGPFEVVSAVPNSVLKLQANPGYWKHGYPKAKSLTFTSVGTDASAVEAIQAGQAQVYEGLGSVSLATSAKKSGLNVCKLPSTSSYYISLHTASAPFNNILAREAIYYATNPQPILKAIYNNQATISQAPGGPGALYYEPKVPGYRTYDLAKAKALVKSLGGLNFTMYFLNSGLYQELAPTLQTEFKAAGINANIQGISQLGAAIAEFDTHKWPAFLWVMGSYDPAGGIGVSFFLASTGPFSGVHDPTVDSLINKGASSANPSVRASAYQDLAKYMNQQAYAPFICAGSAWDAAVKGVSGPGLTTAYGSFGQGPLVQWESVSNSNG